MSPTLVEAVPSLSSRGQQALKLPQSRQNSVKRNQCGGLGLDCGAAGITDGMAQSEIGNSTVIGTNRVTGQGWERKGCRIPQCVQGQKVLKHLRGQLRGRGS